MRSEAETYFGALLYTVCFVLLAVRQQGCERCPRCLLGWEPCRLVPFPALSVLPGSSASSHQRCAQGSAVAAAVRVTRM